MATLNSLTLNGTKYDCFVDNEARDAASNGITEITCSEDGGIVIKTPCGAQHESGPIMAGGLTEAAQEELLDILDTTFQGKLDDAVNTALEASAFEERIATMEQQMKDLMYEAIAITSFATDAGTKEYGETVNSVNLYWTISKEPTTLTLDGQALAVSARSKSITGLSITKDTNKTWKLVATDERGTTAQQTTSITFCNGVYYGVGAVRASYDSAFVLGLTKNLRNSKLSPVTVTAGEGQYIFYCLPKRMGTCAFSVGGFEGGFELAATISFKNASGYTEDYYIYKSVNANLGKTTVYVS